MPKNIQRLDGKKLESSDAKAKSSKYAAKCDFIAQKLSRFSRNQAYFLVYIIMNNLVNIRKRHA